MKKLTKAQETEHLTHVGNLADARAALESAIDALNSALAGAKADLEAKQEEFNHALEEANAFRQSLADEMDTYFGEKPEKWQESDAGSSYTEWRDAWSEEFEVDGVEMPEEVEYPDFCGAEDFENLPFEPS